MHQYFAYGSNLSLEQMEQRCPGSKLIGPGWIDGYRLEFNFPSKRWGGGAADIIADKGSTVWGLLYELTDQDLENLDQYENYPTGYDRFQIAVQTDLDKVNDVLVYFVVDKKDFIPPSEIYLNIIKKAAREFGFPKGYRRFLDNVLERLPKVSLHSIGTGFSE